MRKVILYQWEERDFQDNRFSYLEDLIETVQLEDNGKPILLLVFGEGGDIFQLERLNEHLTEKYQIDFEASLLVIENLPFEKQSDHLGEVLNEAVSPDDDLYIHLGRGEPRLQHMVAHFCIQYYQDQLTLLTGNGFTFEYFNKEPIEERMTEQEFRHHVHELIQSGNFRSAKKLINTRIYHKGLNRLLDFGSEMYSLTLTNRVTPDKGYFTELINALEELGANKKEINYVRYMQRLKNEEQQAFINFIYNYCSFLYKNNQLVDFIVLYYRLAEESLLYALGWDYEDSSNGTRIFERRGKRYSLNFPKWRVSKHFHRYLQALKEEIRRIEARNSSVQIHPNKPIGLEKLNKRDRYFAEVYISFNSENINEFLKLRHEGVSGHGFAEFTKEKFEGICGQPPLEMIKPILKKYNLLPQYSLFNLTQKAILGLVFGELREEVSE